MHTKLSPERCMKQQFTALCMRNYLLILGESDPLLGCGTLLVGGPADLSRWRRSKLLEETDSYNENDIVRSIWVLENVRTVQLIERTMAVSTGLLKFIFFHILTNIYKPFISAKTAW